MESLNSTLHLSAKKQKSQAGFSLLEAVMSLFLLSIVLMGMMAFSTATMIGQKRQNQTMAGMNVGQDVIEHYRGFFKDPQRIDSVMALLKSGTNVQLPSLTKKVKNTTYTVVGVIDSTSLDENTLKISSRVKWARPGPKMDTSSVALSGFVRRSH